MLGTPSLSVPDLAGTSYRQVLARLHEVLAPRSYLEIGTEKGETLALARCASIAIDPAFQIDPSGMAPDILNKPAMHFFRMTSDAFFSAHDPAAILGRPIDFAFLDGMHRCEFLLRDFIQTERHCRANSVIALHDCLPPEEAITSRASHARLPTQEHRIGWWTGDVWRTALLLKRVRPDLRMMALDAAPTGLVLVTNLDPASRSLQADYTSNVEAMLGWNLAEIGVDGLFDEMDIRPVGSLSLEEDITAAFWL